MDKIKIAIVDDQPLFVKGLVSLLEHFKQVQVITQANHGKELLNSLKHRVPQVILMDVRMPVMDGIAATEAIKKDYPYIKIIMLTMHDEERLVLHLLEKGANGYLLKDAEPEEVVSAIEDVVAKDYYFNEYVSSTMLKNLHNRNKPSPSFPGIEDVTQRETEVLELICASFTTAEIAEQLHISARTVEGHRKNLLAKLAVRNTAGLVVAAVRHRLVDLEKLPKHSGSNFTNSRRSNI